VAQGTRKASHVSTPNDVLRTTNDFGVGKFAITTTHGVNPLPLEWSGKWIQIKHVGAATEVHIGFSKSASAEVDRTVSAAAAGSTTSLVFAKVGEPIGPDEWHDMKLPDWIAGETMYLVREGDDVADGYVRLA
jgi:hypothetical protein